jgi:hypothetical protein
MKARLRQRERAFSFLGQRERAFIFAWQRECTIIFLERTRYNLTKL